MLTKYDLRHNLRLLRLASFLSIIPVNFDPMSGRMERQKSKKRRALFRFWQFLAFSQGIFVLIRTIQIGKDKDVESNWDLIPIMISLCVGFACLFSMTLYAFHVDPQGNIKIFNEILNIRSKNFLIPSTLPKYYIIIFTRISNLVLYYS